MIRLVTAILCVAGLASSGCFHTKHPTAAKITGGAMLAVATGILLTTPNCDRAPFEMDDDPHNDFGEALGFAIADWACATAQVVNVALGLALGTTGAIVLLSGMDSTDESPPPRDFYGTTAPGLATVTRARFDGPNAQLIAVPDANPAAVQMARTAWFAARLGHCDSVVITSRKIAALDSHYFKLAVATNATIATCLQR